jgi:lysophospholipase L1-like esterase
VEEGLNGRTTVHQDPLEEGRCGFSYLGPCLQSHKPIHAVVLLLGTNDLKARFGLPPADVAEGAAVLAQVVQRSGTGPEGVAPALLLVCPPAIVEVGHLPLLAEKFGGAAEKSQRLPSLYEAWAQRLGCAYLDAQEVVEPSLHDGLHLEAREHQKLGEAITKAVRQLV